MQTQVDADPSRHPQSGICLLSWKAAHHTERRVRNWPALLSRIPRLTTPRPPSSPPRTGARQRCQLHVNRTRIAPYAVRTRPQHPRKSIRRARITDGRSPSILRAHAEQGHARRSPRPPGFHLRSQTPIQRRYRLAQPLRIGPCPTSDTMAGTSTPAPTWTAKSTLLPCIPI